MKFILRHCTDCSLAQRPGYGGMSTFTSTHLALLQHYQTETGNALWNRSHGNRKEEWTDMVPQKHRMYPSWEQHS